MSKNIYKIVIAFLAFSLPLGLYLKTLSPTYIPVDSAEFALCMHTWGICHPPGFALYVLLGKIFMDIFPVGSVIFRANLLSAIFGAATIFVVYLTQVELKVKKELALLVSLILAVTTTFWEYSIAADVFTLATLLVALTIYLVFKRRLLLSIFTLGLSASHLYLTAILLPVIYWFLVGFKFKLREVLYSVGVFVFGFFPQAIMYMRMQQSPEINWGHAQGVGGFYDFVRRKEFGNIFLLSNPVLTFSIIKFFKHIWVFLVHIMSNFGIVLPILVIVSGVLGQFRDKKYIFLMTTFLMSIIVQLFLISTIDPLESNSPFQISKFYLVSLVPLVLLIGISYQKIVDKLFGDEFHLPVILLFFVLLIYAFANFKAHDLSHNYFSRDLVLDAMGQLPEGAMAITISHIFNFGTRYEQIVNRAYLDKTVLYIPNEKNFDNESYYPSVFKGQVDSVFVDKVRRDTTLGKAETYILETISRNLNRDIYILQGDFEANFFDFLKPYIKPYGLWWKVDRDASAAVDLSEAERLLSFLRNGEVKFNDFYLKQQKLDTLTYAVSYHSAGIMFASLGKYDIATQFLMRSNEVHALDNIDNEIKLINGTKLLDSNLRQLQSEGDLPRLEKLGNNLFILKNYLRCAAVFDNLLTIDPRAEIYNNLASCQASAGRSNESRINYEKALQLNPNLEKAKEGLAVLGND